MLGNPSIASIERSQIFSILSLPQWIMKEISNLLNG